MMKKTRQTYDREFKQKAVELSFARGNAKEIAGELGILPELLYRWRREYQQYDKRRRHSALGYKTIDEFNKINSNFKNAA